MSEWFENSEFWEVLYPVIFPESGFSDAVQQLDEILALIPGTGKRVLDLCCGPGRIAIPLAEKRYEVTGVDITAFLLDKARMRSQARGTPVEWIEADMRDFIRPDTYDMVLNLYSSFGYFKHQEDDLKVLKNIVSSLKTGGVFLMDLMGKEVMARIFQPTTSSSTDAGLFVQCHEILDGWNRIKNEWILISNGTVHRFVFEHSLYSAKELTDLCMQAGLTGMKVFGGYDKRPYDTRASRLVHRDEGMIRSHL